jgi:DNA-directed RNA polymerase subunit beta
LAASRSTNKSSTNKNTSTTLAPRRISFAKISDPLEVPKLLDLQTTSFDWLVGNEAWQAAAAARIDAGEDVSLKSGLEEIFEEISPIEDFSGTMSLSFENPVFYDPKNTVDECKEKDFTYSAPLYVSAEFTNNETGEIKGQTVFMGDFPLMTDKGTFVINGTERVVVSQLVRSPGVYFERTPEKTSDKDIYSARVIPAVAHGSSSRSTSATWSACASTASASRTSRCCSRRSVGPNSRSVTSSASTSR